MVRAGNLTNTLWEVHANKTLVERQRVCHGFLWLARADRPSTVNDGPTALGLPYRSESDLSAGDGGWHHVCSRGKQDGAGNRWLEPSFRVCRRQTIQRSCSINLSAAGPHRLGDRQFCVPGRKASMRATSASNARRNAVPVGLWPTKPGWMSSRPAVWVQLTQPITSVPQSSGRA